MVGVAEQLLHEPPHLRIAPPPPAPPPFAWSCICVEGAPKYNCSGQINARAWLACNGVPAAPWDGMGDCRHALGCRKDDGCAPRWGTGREQKWAIYTTNYRKDLCEPQPPQPPRPPTGPPPAPPPMWCEQYHTARTALNGSQPANSLTSLLGLGLGAYGLYAAARVPSAYYHASCSLMVLTGLGSAVHHWAPRVGFTHAADWLPMLLLTACCATHTAHVLARVLLAARPRVGLVTRGLVLFGGLTYASLCMLVYTVAGAHRLQILLGGIGFILLGHASLLATILFLHGCSGSRRPPPSRRPFPPLTARQAHDTAREVRTDLGELARLGVVRVVRAYLAIAAVATLGLVSQRLESPCPSWLLRTPHVYMYPHALWHVAIFHSLYSSATLLLYFEARLDADVALSSPCVRAPWLLLRVVANRLANPTGTAEGRGCEGTGRAARLPREPADATPRPGVVVACYSSGA